jgi:CBS domain-containing protein
MRCDWRASYPRKDSAVKAGMRLAPRALSDPFSRGGIAMKARDIMTRDPRTVTPDTPITEAARLMKEQDVGILPVVESSNSRKLVGVITDRDITVRHVAANHSADCKVSEAMSSGVKTCRDDDDVNSVMDVMGSEQVRRIPIVDERGTLVGIIAQADIVIDAPNDKRAERTVEKISEKGGRHQQ